MYNKLIYKGLVGENNMEPSEKANVHSEFNKVDYIDELVLKLQKFYSQNIIDKNFFDRAVELLKQERIEVSSDNVKSEREAYLNKIEQIDSFKDLERINDLIYDKLKYPIENKGFLIASLNEKLIDMMNNSDIAKQFEAIGDLVNLIDNKKSLINEENKKIIYKYIDENSKNDKNVESIKVNFKDMPIEEQRKYIEIEKQGIKMRMLEVQNFSELDTIYNRILNKWEDTDYSLGEFLKIEFTKTFENIFKSSYIYYLAEDYSKNYGNLDISDLSTEDGKLTIKNDDYECAISKALCKKEKIRYLDDKELEALKKIINKTYSYFTSDFIENKLKYLIKLPEKQISMEERLEEIKKTIEKILNRDENRFFRSTTLIEFDFKFEEKLKKCKNTYNEQFKDEVLLLIFDNTIFKTCERGFVLTDKNLYFKNDMENTSNINIYDIDDIELNGDNLYVNDSMICCDIIRQEYREKFKDTMIVITYLIQNGMDSSKKIDAVVEEVLSV